MSTLYDEVGGQELFRRLVDGFYDGVEHDPVLRPLYPEGDLSAARDRLRMRHATWRISTLERDAWIANMRRSLDALELPPEHRAAVWDHLERAAHSLVNAPDDPVP